MGSSIVGVLSFAPTHTYIPARNRIVEALGVTDQLGYTTRSWSRPGNEWLVDVETAHCPCRMHLNFRHCVHVASPLQTRGIINGVGKDVLVNSDVASHQDHRQDSLYRL
ncbi:LOW QUALITY PROTEIN: hypothetical protein PHPALM_20833 [Phytophthora palmivora]|uniref:SWIM-type domain-containing protein n=1 Tax=Phytophthora palmivora TaxID=4796 RepID=A0A2P4XDV2_9STRA|nr:LOW QUALITY PROTEIN: hypothetical protein PHPALM_20833 [Phytophthora palmivora]